MPAIWSLLPGRSTRNASASTLGLSGHRLNTPLEITTPTESASGLKAMCGRAAQAGRGCSPAATAEALADDRTSLPRHRAERRACPWSARSAAKEALLPLVDEDVGDDRGLPRPQPAAGRSIPGLQCVQFLPARWGGEQGLKLLLPLLESFLRQHRL